jgi:hypothetical protein
MAIIVVGGSGKGVGKTSLVCGLIAALPEFLWTGVKITTHDYGRPERIWEEPEAGQGTDTARYLAAGARRALLVTVRDDALPIDEILKAVGRDADLIFESNAVASRLEADLCLGVVGPEGKPSFANFMRWMDAAVVLAGAQAVFVGSDAMPVFRLEHLERISPEMLRWLRGKLRVAD